MQRQSRRRLKRELAGTYEPARSIARPTGCRTGNPVGGNEMSLRKPIFGWRVQLLTKKMIYVRRVRPKAMGLCSMDNFDGSWRCSGSQEGDASPELVRRRIVRVVCLLLSVVVWEMVAMMPFAQAEHEVDHRFIVEGYVCGADGRPVANQEVMVKDTRISLGKTTYTDSDGFYSVTLHLHNDNQGDPILVAAGDREQRLTAKFDAKDLKAERKMSVHFGSGCEGAHSASGRWVYYSVGLGLAGVAVFAGAKMLRRQRRSAKRGKRQRN